MRTNQTKKGWFEGWWLSGLVLTLACSSSSSNQDAAMGWDGAGRNDGPIGRADSASSEPIDGRSVDGAGGVPTDAALDVPMTDLPAPLCGPLVVDGGAIIDAPSSTGGSPSPLMSFFVTSVTSVTGNLGGLAGADQRCQSLAQSVGAASPNWRAYVSVAHDPPSTGPSVNARDRIGQGPWYNARGELLANDLASLHARKGDARAFLDERGRMICGQWTGSPPPVEHDVLTGSNADGTLALGKTCDDWTSDAAPVDGGVSPTGSLNVARVGHSDGLGPQCSSSTSPVDYTSWSSAHDNAGCNNTVPRGGAGRIYCFKVNP